jgi:hypothetical protein
LGKNRELNNLINSQTEEPKYINFIPGWSVAQILCLQQTNTVNRGFKFNLHQDPKHWLKMLDLEAGSAVSYLEAGSAVSYLPPLHPDLLRIQVAKNIGSFNKQQNSMMYPIVK